MIRGRGHRPYRPPQLLTGHIDDFPLVPETPIDIAPRPILSAPKAPTTERPAAPVPAAPNAEVPVAAAPPAGTPPIAGGPVAPTEPIAAAPTPPPASKAVIDCREAAKEMAEISPTIANVMLRILESEGLPPAAATIEVAAPKSKSRLRKKSHPRKKKTSPPPERLSRLELHQTHCSICGYEEQDEIDEAFVSWESVGQIAEDYDLDRRAIYRHARATGLYAKRDRNIRCALGRIIQRAESVPATADSVVRAIKILTHVNAHGDWVQPPTHVIFSSATVEPAAKRSVTPCKVKKELKP